MFSIITYPSALDYWLRTEECPKEYMSLEGMLLASSFGEDTLEKIIEKHQFSKPLHLMVSSAKQRKKRKQELYHVIPKGLPPDSFVMLSETVYIVCPELCLLLAAGERSVPELVCLANNFCAVYRKDENSRYGQSDRKPITTTAKIKAYLDKVKNVNGIKKASRSVRYATDRSNSSMESAIAAIAHLPFMLGGFALPKSRLNARIDLSQEAAEFYGKKAVFGDMVWENQKLIVEYDSNLVHLDAGKFQEDKKRQTALMMSGYTVFSITWGQLQNPQRAEAVFMELRRQLGCANCKARSQKFANRRQKAMDVLFHQAK